MKILVVEDDKGIIDFLIPELKHEGYETAVAETGRQGLEKFKSENPDMILLDVMLPELNGIEVLRRIREESQVPVILETARGETIDKINGLNMGADDYIAKPFDIEELLARINALVRRSSYSENKKVTSYKDLEIDSQGLTMKVCGNEVVLSKTEFFILKFFLANQGTALSRDQILDGIWGKGHYIDQNTVDVYVGYLRKKISEYTKNEYIRTVRGVGYKFE